MERDLASATAAKPLISTLAEREMSIFEKHNLGLKAKPDGNTYHEQWVSGTYIVAGVFQRKKPVVTVPDIEVEIPELFALLKSQKKARWPKGICGYYAIPIYTCDALDDFTVDWLHSRPKYRYAMWHEPVLYDRLRNVAEMNEAWQFHCSAFRPFLFEVIFEAVKGLAQKEGYPTFPQVNGKQIDVEEGQQSPEPYL